MKTTTQNKIVILWAGRIMSMAYALFISIFAMGVFDENHGFWETTGALIMHLCPTFLILLIMLLAWKRQWFGGIAYTLLGLAYIFTALGKFDWTTYALISGPLFILGILYAISWHQDRQL